MENEDFSVSLHFEKTQTGLLIEQPGIVFVFFILSFSNSTWKGLESIRGVFGPMSKISFTLSYYRFAIWDKNYRCYFVI